jgi:hypothetical protein
MTATAARQGKCWVMVLLGLGLSLGAATGAVSCGGDDAPAVKATPSCLHPSDCNSPLVCVQGYCVAACLESRDCPAGQRCVKTNDGVACQPPEQKKCAYRSDCAMPLTCGVDQQCRNECHADVDCAKGQKCTSVSGLCADPGIDQNYNVERNEFDNPTDAAVADAGVPDAAGTPDAPADSDLPAPAVDATSPGVVTGDRCVPADGGVAPEQTANDDRDHATALALATPFGGCLQALPDVDYYEFTIPAGSVQGGWAVVRVTDLATQSYLRLKVFSALDNGLIQEVASRTDGADASAFFAAKAGTKFRASVSKYNDDPRYVGPYTISVSFQAVPEPGEPNSTRAQASVIQPGVAFQGIYFAGLDLSTGPPAADWMDWFRVTLPAGGATVSLTDGPSDVMGAVDFYDPLGTSLMHVDALTLGADIKIAATAAAAGDYFVSVTQRNCCALPAGQGAILPVYASHPYTLTVTSP